MPREIRPPFRTVKSHPPHPATVVQAKLPGPHPATVVQKKGAPTTIQRMTSAKDPSEKLQQLINCLGAGNVLAAFASFLGREDMAYRAKESDERASRQVVLPKNFAGLAFGGAHWKGYENGEVKYDSYEQRVQQGQTNNYCQSYACFLWASRGLRNAKHGVDLVAGQFPENVMKISALWVEFFKHQSSFAKGRKWLGEACPGWEKALETLKELSKDRDLANTFATSK